MYAPIILHGHIDAPIYEKPRLFSHWKPSLAQVTSNLNVHSQETLRVLHQVVQSANIRAEARLQASQPMASSQIPSPSTASPFLGKY